ncbi:MAG TPA: helix-turn-helix domain-containing protein, partial [Pseudolabrys sp.]|nr:helix-turn-helix domain-containing protein [Pseudolabrys sp.]
PDGFGGRGLTAQSLTEKVRALYANSAVPVAEIARLCGVSERTIYKYAARHRWPPRYAWGPKGARPRGRRPAPRRGASWQARARFAPVKGAGARFIRRADKSKPFAVGLKATDAAAAARAAADCAQADAHARAAQQEARTDYYHQQRQRAWAQINRTLAEINDYADEYGKKHMESGMRARVPADDVLMNAMQSALAAWTDWLEALRREEAEGAAGAVVPAQAGTHTL